MLRQLGAARGRTGSIAFTATPGPQRRQILANVYEQGTPGPALTVASHQPPQRVTLAAVRRIRVHRSGARAALSWATVPHATTYDVRVVLNDGDGRFYITRLPGVRIAGLFLEIGGQVTVRAEGDSVYTLTGRSHAIALPAAVHYPRGGIRTRLTASPRCNSSAANNARCLGPPSASGRSSSTTANGPRNSELNPPTRSHPVIGKPRR